MENDKINVTQQLNKQLWNRFKSMAALQNKKVYELLEELIKAAVDSNDTEIKNAILKEAGFCE